MSALLSQPIPETAGSPHLLLLAFHSSPENTSGAQRPRRFQKYLRQRGWRVDTISRRLPGVAACEGVTRVPHAAATRRLRWAESAARMIQRYCLPYNEQLPWAPHAIDAARSMIALHPDTTILSTSPPLATHFVAAALKREFGVPWVSDFRDPLSDNPFRSRRFAKPYDRFIERMILRQADAVICNTDTLTEIWRRRYPQFAAKVSLLWNGFDPDETVIAAPPLTRGFRVWAHVGSLYGGRRPDALLESLARLLQAGRIRPGQVRLQLAGPVDPAWRGPQLGAPQVGGPQFGAPQVGVIEKLRQAGCLEVKAQELPRAEAQRLISEADGLVLFDVNTTHSTLQVPAKLFDYIRVGRPVLAFTPPASPSERILRQSGIAQVSIHPADDAAATDGKVLAFLNLPATPQRPAPWFEENFSAPRQVAQLHQLLEHLAQQRRSARD